MTRTTDHHLPHHGAKAHHSPVASVEKSDHSASPFAALGLIPELVRAVAESGYTEPTPIQQQSIGLLLQGRDLLGCAQTGTGKTAAFALPIIQLLHAQKLPPPVEHKPVRHPPAQKKTRALVLSPTRELASQIEESFRTYGAYAGLTSTVIFGGVKQGPQVQKMRTGVDILVATPGRLLDLMGQGFISLRDLQFFVLDEADRMLDMGFIHDVRKVLAALPPVRHSLLFSATMPPDIEALAMTFLRNPARVAVAPVSSTAERIAQSVYKVAKNDKPRLLAHLLQNPSLSRVLVFTRTKHGANKVVKQLGESGFVAEAIHGNKSQNAREAALAHFKTGETRILVATDIAARGIDVDNVSHVINYDLPNEPESYVHRIGRTARAGAEGVALAFCDWDEQGFLNSIEKLIRLHVPVISDHPFATSHRGGGRSEPSESASPQRPRGHRPPSSSSGTSGPSGHPRTQAKPSQPSSQPPRQGDRGRPAGKPHVRPSGGGSGGGAGGRSRTSTSEQRERMDRQLDWMKRYT